MLVSGLVSTLENACTTFCTNNAVKIAFKRRNISNGIEITLNLRQNRRMIASVWACFVAGKRVHYVHNAVNIAFKRRNITNGKEITLNFL